MACARFFVWVAWLSALGWGCSRTPSAILDLTAAARGRTEVTVAPRGRSGSDTAEREERRRDRDAKSE